MAGRLALDTSFLIDLQRERVRRDPAGPAHRLLASDPDVELHLSSVALGEFAEGFADQDDPVLRLVRELHVLLPIDEETALVYGRLTRALRNAGQLIGSNDLWIAAASLRHAIPLATGNAADFRRVEGLEIVAYR
jgi:predicted nucleic acid-binding protein